MNNPKPSKRLQQITNIATEVVGIARAHFNSRRALTVSHKSADQAVTEADREVETAIRTAMANDFPGEAIVGEEFGGEGGDNFWTIDPIDGTANFLNGLPFWGIAIGHMSDGIPDLGVIILPELNVTVAGEHDLLFLNGSSFVHTPSPTPTLSLGQAKTETLTESLALHQSYRNAGISVYHWRCSAVSLAWTALGQISGHLHNGTTLWDAVPGVALCRAAGLDARMGTGPSGMLWVKVGEPSIHNITGPLWEKNSMEAK